MFLIKNCVYLLDAMNTCNIYSLHVIVTNVNFLIVACAATMCFVFKKRTLTATLSLFSKQHRPYVILLVSYNPITSNDNNNKQNLSVNHKFRTT